MGIEARVAVGTCMRTNETKPNTNTCTVPYLYPKYGITALASAKGKEKNTGKCDRTIDAVFSIPQKRFLNKIVSTPRGGTDKRFWSPNPCSTTTTNSIQQGEGFAGKQGIKILEREWLH